MNKSYSRLLNSPIAVEHFLENVLDYKRKKESKYINKIVTGERYLLNFDSSDQTINSMNFRKEDCRDDKTRWERRNTIVKELYSQKRLELDDNLKLGTGGALPINELQYNKDAVIIIGLPASGKSSIANKVADTMGAIILDSDYAKRKLPEFKKKSIESATILHEESDSIIFGFNSNETPEDFISLFSYCKENNINIVIPKIGHNEKSILKLADSLNNVEYKVHLILVSLDRKKSTIRAYERYKSSGRYIPLSLIFDGYSNDPILAYYRLKNHHHNKFSSFGKVSTDVNKFDSPTLIESINQSPLGNINL